MALDVLDSTITRILWTGPDKFSKSGVPFVILKLTGGQIAKGSMDKAEVGVRVRLWGEWQTAKGYDNLAFRFSSYDEIVDQSADGVTEYLSRHIDNLGPVRSLALVEEFGVDTLTVLRTDATQALRVPGISQKVVDSIVAHFAKRTQYDPAAYAKLIDLFRDHKVPRSVIKALLEDWGSGAPKQVTTKPYRTLLEYPRMGWKTVDAFATATLQYDPGATDRHMYAIIEGLRELSLSDGHTYAHRVDIEQAVFPLLSGRPRDEGWVAGVEGRHIVELTDDELTAIDEYALPDLMEAEHQISRCLAILAESARPLPCEVTLTGLNAGQMDAWELIKTHGVVVLAGAPGTGKSYLIAKALAALVGGGMKSIRIACPTGKAAKRSAELLQGKIPGDSDGSAIPCTTIHRLLGPKPNDDKTSGPSAEQAKVNRGRDGFSFTHNEDDPIPVDLLIIDETSMVDVKLGASLLRAIAPGTRVVFVGDPNQLPSVGPGSVLRDMIDAGIPTAMLTEVQRNSGRIVRACHAIKDGKIPEPAQRLNLDPAVADNWLHAEIDDPVEIAAKIVSLHCPANPYKAFPDPIWDIQVVTPQKSRLPIACDNLNRLLSERLNSYGRLTGDLAIDDEPAADDHVPFWRGDKVIRTKNGLCDLMVKLPEDTEEHVDWRWVDGESDDKDLWKLVETDIVNGDMGMLIDIVEEPKDTYVVVEFRTPRRLCRLSYNNCHIIQAYAVTAHKAQGSGFPFVIVPVHHSFYWDAKAQRGIFNREWIYTAKSRAEKMLVTVGQFSAIQAAVGRPTVHRRNTKLAELLRRWMGGDTGIEVAAVEATQ